MPSVAYFDGAGAAMILFAWVAVGLVLWFVAPLLPRNATPSVTTQAEASEIPVAA
ncbi:hypothetical protein [Microbacterium paludicola]|uniref:hypothetical protein n=1 Tax=Microbacterium paludicola TaxID=300019 RepID=UPI001642E149|nr:hypothetical protein [Microbacterium paludicola]